MKLKVSYVKHGSEINDSLSLTGSIDGERNKINLYVLTQAAVVEYKSKLFYQSKTYSTSLQKSV